MKNFDRKDGGLLQQPCPRQACAACAQCLAVNYEERRPLLPPVKTLSAQLYAAEAQHYDFYYAPLLLHAV